MTLIAERLDRISPSQAIAISSKARALQAGGRDIISLLYYPTVTREPFRNQGRITTGLETGKLTSDLGLPALDPAGDRVMLCGSPDFLADMVRLLDGRGFLEGSSSTRGHYVIEKAFVEK